MKKLSRLHWEHRVRNDREVLISDIFRWAKDGDVFVKAPAPDDDEELIDLAIFVHRRWKGSPAFQRMKGYEAIREACRNLEYAQEHFQKSGDLVVALNDAQQLLKSLIEEHEHHG